jgi:hypothetical protein
VRYLPVRIADQQQVIANMVTVDSEQRLGRTLLQLARTMGKKDPRGIELRISHEELSEMVGTTRPRISLFMQRFHHLGLIETNREHFLIIKEIKLHRLPRSNRLKRPRSSAPANFFLRSYSIRQQSLLNRLKFELFKARGLTP